VGLLSFGPQPVLVLRASALTRAGRVRVARLRAGHAIVDETSSTGQHRIPGRLPLRPRPGWLAAGPAPLHGAPGPVPLRPGQAGLTCTRSACRASTGLPSLPRQTWKPSSPGRQADPFRRPGHADPSAYPRARSPYSDQQPPQRCIAPRPSPLMAQGRFFSLLRNTAVCSAAAVAMSSGPCGSRSCRPWRSASVPARH